MEKTSEEEGTVVKRGTSAEETTRKRHEERREAFSWLCCDLLPHTYPQLNPLVVAVK